MDLETKVQYLEQQLNQAIEIINELQMVVDGLLDDRERAKQLYLKLKKKPLFASFLS